MEWICPDCRGTLSTDDGATARCLTHGGQYQVLFSRWGPPEPPAQPAQAFVEGTTCQQHPAKPAIAPCSQCGTPVCDVCAFPDDAGGQLCPNCIARRAARPRTYVAATPVAPVIPSGMFCEKHPSVAATQKCSHCGAYMCDTCDFVFAPSTHVCPRCATKTETGLSPKRKKLMIGSFIFAAIASFGLIAVMSGIFASAVKNEVGAALIGYLFLFMVFLPATVGMGMGFSAIDRRRNNPIYLWGATIWNCLIVAIFVLLCIIGNLKG